MLEAAPRDIAAFQIAQANVSSISDHRLIDSGKTVRIFRNKPQHRYVSPIHEQIVPSLNGGKVGNTPFFVWHYGFLADVVLSKQKIERNRSMLLKYLDELAPGEIFRNYILMQLGRESQRLSRPEEAVQYYSQAVQGMLACPDNHPFFVALGAYHMENLESLGRHQEVKEFAPKMLERFPWSADLWFLLGVAELNLGEHAMGVTHLLWSTTVGDVRRAEQEFYSPSRSVAAWGNAAKALLALGAPEAALAVCMTALKEPPEEPQLALFALDLVAARADLRAFFAQRASDSALGQILKSAFLRSDDALLEGITQEVLGARPGDATANFWLGSMLLRKGDYQSARAWLERVPGGGEVGGFAGLGVIAACAALDDRELLHTWLDSAPNDLYHTLQREIAGIAVSNPPKGYAAYRDGLRALLQQWHVDLPEAPVP
jgi:tetratricopeptide (TPR) repeat protein